MIFELSEEQQLLKRTINEFARSELAPAASHWDASEEFPWESVRKMSEIGLTGLRLPRQYGGAGSDLIAAGVALEEVARFDLSCAIILCSSNISGGILMHASEDIKSTWLPDIVKGKRIVAFAAAEPEAGSEIRAMKTLAEQEGNTYVINGEKSMITFARVAQGFITLVRTHSRKGGISCLFVEADSAGITVHPLQSWCATKLCT